MSSDLEWLLIRKNNSHIVKRVPEGPIFSKEPGNLLNLHSHKYSGIANKKTIHISQSPSGVQIVTRKKDASPHAVRKSSVSSSIRNRSGPRRAAGVTASLAKREYRPDLRKSPLERRHGNTKVWCGHDVQDYMVQCGTDQKLGWIRPMSLSGNAALARTSALLLAQQTKKPAPPKKTRGKKAAKVEA
ncbi:ribosomal L28e protein family-domain-containing protein [Cytidiella melzeri]|nr:ribosomal L28e protein family-domain-containing protein [Cytidiella melzeri]